MDCNLQIAVVLSGWAVVIRMLAVTAAVTEGGEVTERNFMMGPMQATVQRKLSELTRSADEFDTERLANLARVEIPLLVAALRDTLAEHRPDARGRCSSCRPKLSRLWSRRRGQTPCRAYLAAQLRLGQDAVLVPASTSHQRRRKRNPHYVS